jgi:hypothetical protein
MLQQMLRIYLNIYTRHYSIHGKKYFKIGLLLKIFKNCHTQKLALYHSRT